MVYIGNKKQTSTLNDFTWIMSWYSNSISRFTQIFTNIWINVQHRCYFICSVLCVVQHQKNSSPQPWGPWPLQLWLLAQSVCSACCWFWPSTFATTNAVWVPEERGPSTTVCLMRRTRPWTIPSSLLEPPSKTSSMTWPPQALDPVLFALYTHGFFWDGAFDNITLSTLCVDLLLLPYVSEKAIIEGVFMSFH